jgi:hypothetical protein
MVWRIAGFSFSRENALAFVFLAVLSVFCRNGFRLLVTELEVDWYEPYGFDVEENDDGEVGERTDLGGLLPVETEALRSDLSKSASVGSVSLSTLDCCWLIGFFRCGSCLYKTAMRSRPGVDL